LAIIGSNWGRPQHPAWVHNLSADPHATLARDHQRLDVIARELTGPEADDVWKTARGLYRGFRAYPSRTHGRAIRVFAFEKAPA
jgi:deazaflavin-dependent oxidoreductase (nitroreductase family)